MVSTVKRMKYVSEQENELSSSEEDYPLVSQKNQQKLSNGKTKWLSKNAIMARENRLKKKLYLTNLEKDVAKYKIENEKYSKVIENQSLLIRDLNKELKYLKSVIANSSDISKLIRNIHQNTGMSVTTSLDQTLSLNNDYVSKRNQPIARKTAHPWDNEETECQKYPNFPTPESDLFAETFNPDDLLIDDAFLGIPDILIDENSSKQTEDAHLQEHNYTSTCVEDIDEDVGVCLHVSKHRVSLEFCSSCSENAADAWRN